MRLQRQPGKTYVNKAGETVTYDRWAIVLPRDLVEALGWQEGLELTPTTKGATLTLRPATD